MPADRAADGDADDARHGDEQLSGEERGTLGQDRRKRAIAVDGRPRGNHRDHARRCRSLALTESKRGPDAHGEREDADRIIRGVEHRPTDADECRGDKRQLQPLRA